MANSNAHDQATLYTLLTQALALADGLDLTIAAIHIDEARALIAKLPDVPTMIIDGGHPTGTG